MVRISPDSNRIEAFKKELWATQKVREAGVPSTEVLIVDQDEDSEPYMITRRVTGSEATHHPQRERIINQMGNYARIINSIPTKGFGAQFDWTNNGFKYRTWSDYLDNEWEFEKRLQLFTTHKILSQRAVTKLRKTINETRTLRIKPSLSHADLRLKMSWSMTTVKSQRLSIGKSVYRRSRRSLNSRSRYTTSRSMRSTYSLTAMDWTAKRWCRWRG